MPVIDEVPSHYVGFTCGWLLSAETNLQSSLVSSSRISNHGLIKMVSYLETFLEATEKYRALSPGPAQAIP